MSPTAKTNLGLALLLALLLALALLGHQQGPEPVLPGLTAQQVSRIQLDMNGGSWLFQRQGDGWQGGSRPLDHTALNKLATIADATSRRSFPATRANLRELGLEPARALLRLNTLTLSFGSTEPINGYRYLLVGDQVHLIEDRFWPLLLKIRQSAEK